MSIKETNHSFYDVQASFGFYSRLTCNFILDYSADYNDLVFETNKRCP